MSIYKRERHESGGEKKTAWGVRIDVAPSAVGKRKRVSVGTFPTRAEAKAAEAHALSAKDNGTDLNPKRATVAEVVTHFIADRRSRDLAYLTVARYEDIAKFQIVPHLGAMQVSKLKPAAINDWVAKLRAAGSATGRPLSPKTVKHAYNLLDAAIGWAVRLDIAQSNPCDRTEAPKAGRSQVRALSTDDVKRFFAAADLSKWGPYFRLAVGSAARRGEISALRWSDIDFERREMTIGRSAISTADAQNRLQERSTKADRVRIIPLGDLAFDSLRAQRVLQAQDKLVAGSAYQDDGHVFQRALGGQISPLQASQGFRSIRDRLGMSVSLHSLRHTAATMLIGGGVDVRTVSAILGHSSATTTLTAYVAPGENKPHGHQMATTNPPKAKSPRFHEGISPFFGAPSGTRTRDQRIKSPMLYQLS